MTETATFVNFLADAYESDEDSSSDNCRFKNTWIERDISWMMLRSIKSCQYLQSKTFFKNYTKDCHQDGEVELLPHRPQQGRKLIQRIEATNSGADEVE
eukprot:1893907-Ditylum_brightwellii.AAC.1